MKKADDLVKVLGQDIIKGFLLAVYDCYLSQIIGAKPSDFVPMRLSKLTGVTSTVQSVAPSGGHCPPYICILDYLSNSISSILFHKRM